MILNNDKHLCLLLTVFFQEVYTANILACLPKVLFGVTEGVFLFFFGDISKVAVTKNHTNVFAVSS